MTIKMETGSANGQIDLVAKLANFVSTELTGMWVVTEHLTPGNVIGFASDAQVTLRMVAPNDGVYFHLTSMITNTRPRMRLLASTAFTSGLAGENQPSLSASGNDRNTGISIPKDADAISFTYFFIASETYFYGVAKFASGSYQHFCMGIADNYPGVNNGYWYTGSLMRGRWSQAVLDFDDFSSSASTGTHINLFNNGSTYGTAGDVSVMGAILRHDGVWCLIHANSNSATNASAFTSFLRSGTSKSMNVGDLPFGSSIPIFYSPDVVSNQANIVTPLMPGYFITPKIGRAGWWTVQGAIPGARACWTEGYEEDEEITIGSQVWKLFPIYKSRRAVTEPARFMGMAVLIDPGV